MRRLILSIGLLWVSSANAELLQEPEARQGYFIGGGLRSGVWTGNADQVGNFGLLQGGGFVLRAGQMANDWIGFGLVLGGYGGAGGDWSGGFGGFNLETQFVPMQDLALRVSVGPAGMGFARKDPSRGRKDDPESAFGPLYTAGFSYDWFPYFQPGKDESGGFSLAFYVEALLLPGDTANAFAFFTGVEVSYWFGLAAHKLATATN